MSCVCSLDNFRSPIASAAIPVKLSSKINWMATTRGGRLCVTDVLHTIEIDSRSASVWHWLCETFDRLAIEWTFNKMIDCGKRPQSNGLLKVSDVIESRLDRTPYSFLSLFKKKNNQIELICWPIYQWWKKAEKKKSGKCSILLLFDWFDFGLVHCYLRLLS